VAERVRVGAKRLRSQFLTLIGLRRGYYIPYRQAKRMPRLGHRPVYSAVESILATAQPRIAELLQELARFAPEFAAIDDGRPPSPRWTQDWFPRLDAAVAYAMVRRRRPALIVEVGSGHSTRFLCSAVQDGGLATRIRAIDPAPRASLTGLPLERVLDLVPNVGLSPFRDLSQGDILFIDSSHILMPGSDVDFLLTEVMPRMPAGLLVHFHDIFLPDDYPKEWAWRGYNEQAAVAALIANGDWRVVFASRYAVTRLAERVAASAVGPLPMPAGAYESSLWIQRRSD
jgi:hypothetical protein